MIELLIDDRPVQVEEGTTILEAAERIHVRIPRLCRFDREHRVGACRLCVVEVEGQKNLQASCMTSVREGMVVRSNSPRVRQARRVLYELILSDHAQDCLLCKRNGRCELQDLGAELGIEQSRFNWGRAERFLDDSSQAVVRDSAKCILCRRCVCACEEIQGISILSVLHRGYQSTIGTGLELPLGETTCTQCGQCVAACPVGALSERDAVQTVQEMLDDPSLTVVAQTAPAVRVAIGEEFGAAPGTDMSPQMVAALRATGFDHVFDTNFAADLTIMEEGTELLSRLVRRALSDGSISRREADATGVPWSDAPAVLPLITSCSPGWIKYAEHYYPEQLGHLSSCKSPHMMLGALVKTYFAKQKNIDPAGIRVVSVMPCTAKKYEAARPEMVNDGQRNVDAVLTTREMAVLLRRNGLDFMALDAREFDNPLGLSSGAADLFGVTGGVMEAALRTVHELVTGRALPFDGLHLKPMQGLQRIKTAVITIRDPLAPFRFLDGAELSIASTSGLRGAAELLEQIARGENPHAFIEIMGCPGGCISGGGQPRPTTDDVRRARMLGLYSEDERKTLRASHDNPAVAAMYREWLHAPLSEVSHDLLHTSYTGRSRYPCPG